MVLMLATTTPSVLTIPTVFLNPKLIDVCTCESGQGTGEPQQFNIETGEVLRGEKNPLDIGMCQINEYWNGKDARKHGWDIYTEEGNILMANYLYKTQGLIPWNASKTCWSKSI